MNPIGPFNMFLPGTGKSGATSFLCGKARRDQAQYRSLLRFDGILGDKFLGPVGINLRGYAKIA